MSRRQASGYDHPQYTSCRALTPDFWQRHNFLPSLATRLPAPASSRCGNPAPRKRPPCPRCRDVRGSEDNRKPSLAPPRRDGRWVGSSRIALHHRYFLRREAVKLIEARNFALEGLEGGAVWHERRLTQSGGLGQVPIPER